MDSLTKYWYLRDFNFIKALNTNTRKHLSEILMMEYFNKGEEIIPKSNYNNHLFILKQGSIKLIDTTNNIVKYVISNGDLFGQLAFDENRKTNQEVAVALEDCLICYIDIDKLKILVEQYDIFKDEIFKVYIDRIQYLEKRLSDLLTKDSYTRIKEFILDFVKKYGKEKDSDCDTMVAKNLLSHNDIAHLTNTSRQTVSNVLSKLRKESIIDYNSKEIYLTKFA